MNDTVEAYSKHGAEKTAAQNQDFTYSQSTKDIDFVAVADGVSQCELSKEGAEFVCKTAATAVIDEADYLFSIPCEKAAALLVRYFQSQIKQLASENNTDARKYSSTLSFICRHKKLGKIMTFNLGDSCIYTIDSKKSIRQLNISNSFYTATISTMTSGAEAETVVNIYDESEFSSVLLCTDGFWKLMEGNRKNGKGLKEAIRNRDVAYLTEFVDNVCNPDDCTFLYFNIDQ